MNLTMYTHMLYSHAIGNQTQDFLIYDDAVIN